MSIEQIIQEAKQDDDIIGIWVGGSHAKGYADKYSDYDVWIFLTDEAYHQRQKSGKPRKVFSENYEIFYTTLAEVAKFQGLNYAFSDAKPLIDKTGDLQKLMASIGGFPAEKKDEIITTELNAYCNALFYSLKAMRRHNQLGGVLEATQSIEHLLAALFALHGKYKPYDSYLLKELHVLTKVNITDFHEKLYKIITTGDADEQRSLKKAMEKLFRQEDYGNVFDAWDTTSTWKDVLKEK